MTDGIKDTIGCGLGDKFSELFILTANGETQVPERLKTTQAGVKKFVASRIPIATCQEITAEVNVLSGSAGALPSREVSALCSANEARHAASMATDPTIKAALERVAEDEARHAELAYAFVGWAIHTGGLSIREGLRETARRQLAMLDELGSLEPSPTPLHSWGVVSGAERHRLQRDAVVTLVRPALESVVGSLA